MATVTRLCVRQAVRDGQAAAAKKLGAKLSLPKVAVYDHVKAIDAAMHRAEDWGLEKYLPQKRLLPGEPLELIPRSVSERPILTLRNDQLHASFAGAWFLAEVSSHHC